MGFSPRSVFSLVLYYLETGKCLKIFFSTIDLVILPEFPFISSITCHKMTIKESLYLCPFSLAALLRLTLSDLLVSNSPKNTTVSHCDHMPLARLQRLSHSLSIFAVCLTPPGRGPWLILHLRTKLMFAVTL